MARGFQRLRGDMSLALTGMIGNFIMALIIGSVFYNLPFNTGSFYSRGALLFFAILLNAFSSSLEARIQSSFLSYREKRKADLAYADIDSVRPTSNRRKAGQVCVLPSVLRGRRFHDMRSSEQDPNIHLLQYHIVLHDQSPTNSRSILHLLPLLVHLHAGHVDDIQNDRRSFTHFGTGHGSSGCLYPCASDLHRLRRSDCQHAPMVPVDKLP
jgi:hypothetical protein